MRLPAAIGPKDDGDQLVELAVTYEEISDQVINRCSMSIPVLRFLYFGRGFRDNL